MSREFAAQHPISAVIYGCKGTELTQEEQAFFYAANPLGFILFARNIETPEQTRALVAALKACCTHADPWVLIDQEGGRVARLRPPHWAALPAVATLVATNPDAGNATAHPVYQHFASIGAMCADLGINVDCAPVVDLRIDGAHDIIGDRAFGGDPEQVAAFGALACAGLAEKGVLPILKHIPGHGRALADSHESLPVVRTSLTELARTDFKPFQLLNTIPIAMTAHVVYTALDDAAPATLSPIVLGYIREQLGFDGVLMSDDLSMKALKGDFTRRAHAALAAGCDVALHCNGDMAEMQAVQQGVAPLTPEATRRVSACWHWLDAHRDGSRRIAV